MKNTLCDVQLKIKEGTAKDKRQKGKFGSSGRHGLEIGENRGIHRIVFQAFSQNEVTTINSSDLANPNLPATQNVIVPITHPPNTKKKVSSIFVLFRFLIIICLIIFLVSFQMEQVFKCNSATNQQLRTN